MDFSVYLFNLILQSAQEIIALNLRASKVHFPKL